MIHWFSKASEFILLEVIGELFNNLMTVFKTKQFKGELIFHAKKVSGDIYVGLFWAEASKTMIWLDIINYFKVSLE